MKMKLNESNDYSALQVLHGAVLKFKDQFGIRGGGYYTSYTPRAVELDYGNVIFRAELESLESLEIKITCEVLDIDTVPSGQYLYTGTKWQ